MLHGPPSAAAALEVDGNPLGVKNWGQNAKSSLLSAVDPALVYIGADMRLHGRSHWGSFAGPFLVRCGRGSVCRLNMHAGWNPVRGGLSSESNIKHDGSACLECLV